MSGNQETTDPTKPVTVGQHLPEVIGGYRVVSKISSGGMGAVLLATKSSTHGFQKRVALKVMLQHIVESEEGRALFLDEAKLAARLNHQNVCQVFDFGEEQGIFYLAMEHVAGVSVQQIAKIALKGGDKIPPALAARIIADAARGLHHAHTVRDDGGRPLHVVHRDVSPHNLMITFDGTTKVLDFGVAKSRERMTATEAGIVRGKPAYMSPEHASSDIVDARSDVFSLGVILWELVTGKRLFERESPWSTLRAVIEAPIGDPREVTPDLPDAIAAAVRGALTRDPARRFESAELLARTLEPVAAASSVLADFVREKFPDEHRASLASLSPDSVTETHAVGGPVSLESFDGPLRRPSPPLPRIAAALATIGVAAVAFAWLFRMNDEPSALIDKPPLVGVVSPVTNPVVTPLFEAEALAIEPIVEAVVEPVLEPVVERTPAKDVKKFPRKPPRLPPPPAIDAPKGVGILSVHSREWGNLRVDGRMLGATPITSATLPAGSHLVELLDPNTGAVRWTKTIVIEADKKTFVTAN